MTENINIDEEIIQDFFEEFNEAYQVLVDKTMQLEQQPKDQPLINQLFRSIHSIKSNLRMIGLDEVSDLVHAIETVLDDVRHHKMPYDSAMTDVVLLTIDKIKTCCQAAFNKSPYPIKIQKMIDAIIAIDSATAEQRPMSIFNAIHTLDPSIKLDDSIINLQAQKTTKNTIDDDLNFLLCLTSILEKRGPYWEGRTLRLLELSQMMNEFADNPVNREQLMAAVYMHDFTLSFLPIEVIHKPFKELSEEQIRDYKKHPIDAYNLLKKMGHFNEAANICLQHHEQVDGKGYPKGLYDEEISDGAKIISICDRFDILMHAEADINQRKKPTMRALMELNKETGTHFNTRWMDIFNQVIKMM